MSDSDFTIEFDDAKDSPSHGGVTIFDGNGNIVTTSTTWENTATMLAFAHQEIDRLRKQLAERDVEYPRQRDKEGGWTIQTEFLKRVESIAEESDGTFVSWEEIESVLLAAEAAMKEKADECDVPPPGWRCTRPRGHDGPCAAVPIDETKETPDA